MNRGDLRVGDWLVQPNLDRIQRDGRVEHVRPKSMQVLVVLAAHAGEVVSRDELQHVVWHDVHVSEESLSHCIAELRDVLGDDAKAPKYVETVAKHGYRLITSVQPVLSGEADGRVGDGSEAGRWRAIAWSAPRAARLVALGGVLIAAVALGARWLKPAATGGRHLLVLAEWENRTGDEVFDGTLREVLAVELEQAPNITIVSRERAAQVLRLMRQPAGTRVAGDLARQVCRRAGADLLATGEIAKVGEQFLALVEVTRCVGAAPFAHLKATAPDRNRVLDAVSRLAAGLRDRLGEAPPGHVGAPGRIEEITTADLDALRAFTLADEALAERRTAEAITLFDHAIEIDPGFALAHSRLGSTLAALREWKHANEHRRTAAELAEELTERERLYVTAAFKLGQGRVSDSEETLKAWARLYPGDRVPLTWLVVCHVNRGERAEAISWGEAAAEVDASPGALVNLAAAYLNAGRIDDAKSAVAGLNEPGFHYLLALLDGDADRMKRLGAAVREGSVEELDMRAREAQAAMAEGRVRDGRQLVGRAEALGLQLGLLELTAQVLATGAVWEAEIGDPRLALEIAAAALSMSENSSTRALAVLAFARGGALTRARRVLTRIDASPADVDPAIAAGCRRKLAAAIDLASGRPGAALRELEGLDIYEDGGVVNHVALRGDLAELGVFHLRGVALLALGRGQEAAIQFHKILDRRGVSPLSPYYALARLNLARAHARVGDREAARREYEVFLGRWRSADPEGTLIAEVRREAARLTASPPQ